MKAVEEVEGGARGRFVRAGVAERRTDAGWRDGVGDALVRRDAGRSDRPLAICAHRAQVTDDAVKAMLHALNRYGASPLRAEIVQTRRIDEQTFYIVKFVFPRGDATSRLFGFNTAGKITAVGIGSLAGN